MNRVAEVKLTYKSQVKASDRAQIKSSEEAEKIIRPFYDEAEIELRESFYICLLNRRNKVLGVMKLSDGITSGCLVDKKMIAQSAILTNASGVILSHNHPSGEVTPSSQDLNLTSSVKEALKLLDIEVLDHLILSPEEGNYLSMADKGYM